MTTDAPCADPTDEELHLRCHRGAQSARERDARYHWPPVHRSPTSSPLALRAQVRARLCRRNQRNRSGRRIGGCWRRVRDTGAPAAAPMRMSARAGQRDHIDSPIPAGQNGRRAPAVPAAPEPTARCHDHTRQPPSQAQCPNGHPRDPAARRGRRSHLHRLRARAPVAATAVALRWRSCSGSRAGRRVAAMGGHAPSAGGVLDRLRATAAWSATASRCSGSRC